MGPQPGGRPSDERGHGGHGQQDDRSWYQDREAPSQDRYLSERGMGRQNRYEQGKDIATPDRYQGSRDLAMDDAPLPMPGAFVPDTRMTASPSGSASGKERDGDPKTSGERNRSRTRNGRTASGQLRMCKKCGEPLTGQFVRALGGTFHLECFRCRVVNLDIFAYVLQLLTLCRTADKLWPQSFSQLTKKVEKANTPYAKPITSEDWT